MTELLEAVETAARKEAEARMAKSRKSMTLLNPNELFTDEDKKEADLISP